MISLSLFVFAAAPAPTVVQARNPVLAAADPHAEVIDGTVWLYPTGGGTRGTGQRFHAFSSKDLQKWEDHGPVLNFADVKWIGDDGERNHYAWAPAITRRNGKFYFYFSVGPQGRTPARTGVAVGDSPAGPFRDSGKPLLTGGNGFEAIDPFVFQDPKSNKAYFYAGGSAGAKLRIFELKPNMTEFAREIPVKTPPHFTEGAFVHYRRGTYYLTYSHGYWRDASYSAHYATSGTPFGPWRYGGRFLTSDARHKGPGHHSIIRGGGGDQWYIAYHRWNDAKGNGPYQGARSTAFDVLEHEIGGRLKPVKMTDVVPPYTPVR
ncbi:MAG: family 43 glycosylhydrolase [Fimbriimonas sp.]